MDMREAWNLGYESYFTDGSNALNPYDPIDEKELETTWYQGFEAAAFGKPKLFYEPG